MPRPTTTDYGPDQATATADVAGVPSIVVADPSAGQDATHVLMAWTSSSAVARPYGYRVISNDGLNIGKEVLLTEGGTSHSHQYAMVDASDVALPSGSYLAQTYYGSINDGNNTFQSTGAYAF
jgi:hypothetical protein